MFEVESSSGAEWRVPLWPEQVLRSSVKVVPATFSRTVLSWSRDMCQSSILRGSRVGDSPLSDKHWYSVSDVVRLCSTTGASNFQELHQSINSRSALQPVELVRWKVHFLSMTLILAFSRCYLQKKINESSRCIRLVDKKVLPFCLPPWLWLFSFLFFFFSRFALLMTVPQTSSFVWCHWTRCN